MRALVVMAKAPIPGRVKTRLQPAVSPEMAAQLYAAFLDDVLLRAKRWARRKSAEPILAWAGPGEAPASASAFRVVDQGEGDLGARMERARLAAGVPHVVIVGSDAPTMLEHRVDEAFAALDRGRVVFGPTEDGGYDVLGFPSPAPWVLEDIPWSTPQVMETTRDRGRQAGAQWEELTLGWDVDEPKDLERLARDPRLVWAPRTEAVIRAWLETR
ncbi:MAG: TIGR04282 family arsenosugar biosynthesis glycosyltransferase [Myxococcota bacterium]